MYCSITFKGRKDPQDPKMVKLEMIFYKTGYTRIPRVVSITGAYKCWNNELKVLTVLKLINVRIEYFENHEKFKNGKLVKSVGTASMYKQFRTSLSAFTQRQYNKDLSRFYFTDITQKFLLEYIVYLERRGIENGNRAGLRQLLRIFRALVNYAKDELHMYGANPAIFEAATEKMAWGQVESKAVNPNIIRRIEFMDRSLFSEQE